jgi:hypothetical protein
LHHCTASSRAATQAPLTGAEETLPPWRSLPAQRIWTVDVPVYRWARRQSELRPHASRPSGAGHAEAGRNAGVDTRHPPRTARRFDLADAKPSVSPPSAARPRHALTRPGRGARPASGIFGCVLSYWRGLTRQDCQPAQTQAKIGEAPGSRERSRGFARAAKQFARRQAPRSSITLTGTVLGPALRAVSRSPC